MSKNKSYASIAKKYFGKGKAVDFQTFLTFHDGQKFGSYMEIERITSIIKSGVWAGGDLKEDISNLLKLIEGESE